MTKRTLALVIGLLLASVTLADAQAIAPPNTFHPYRGGTNCIQVADANGNFNCASGTKVDPTTGNMTIGGTITFTGFAGGSGTFIPGLIVGAVGSGAQVVGSADFVLATSPSTVASSGPLIQGVTFRVRRVGPGLCQVVVAGGNGLKEFVIPVADPGASFANPSNPEQMNLSQTFSGGPAGC